MESMDKVRLLDPQKGGSLIREIMIMIKVLHTSIQGQTAKWVEKKKHHHKEVAWPGQGGQSGVSLLCLIKRKNHKYSNN